MSETLWYNNDGLTVRFGGVKTLTQPGETATLSDIKTLRADFTHNKLPDYTDDRNNDGTKDAFIPGWGSFIPSGSRILSATLVVNEAFTSAGATTLDIGTYKEDGTVIDADGLFAAVAKTSIDAVGESVAGAGAQVNANGAVVTFDSYIKATVTTGPYTDGAATLVIEYIPPQTRTADTQ